MSGYNFGGLKVLICDDSRHIRSLLRTFLTSFGVQMIRETSNADDGYRDFVEWRPDLVITDWNMTPTSGLEFVERIRMSEDSADPFVPIIMLTGYTELYRVKAARDAGVSVFLAKPVSAQSIYKRLVAIVDDARPFVRIERYFGPDRRSPKRTDLYGGDERRQAMEA